MTPRRSSTGKPSSPTLPPPPPNGRPGRMPQVGDVPFVKDRHPEHCPPEQPVKVRVSYQKLLKRTVLNRLKSNPEKVMMRKNPFVRLLPGSSG